MTSRHRYDAVAMRVDDLILVSVDDHVVERICWEADHPHSDSTGPESPERLARLLADVADDEVAAITHGNALREFRFDPFAHRPPEAGTVAALRRQAADVDTAPVRSGRTVEVPTEPVTLMDLLDRAAKVLDAASGPD